MLTANGFTMCLWNAFVFIKNLILAVAIVWFTCSHTCYTTAHIISLLSSVVVQLGWTPETWSRCVDHNAFELILKCCWKWKDTIHKIRAYKQDMLQPCFQTPQSHSWLHKWQSWPEPVDSKQVLFLWSVHVCLFSSLWNFQVRCGRCPNPFLSFFFSQILRNIQPCWP